MSNWSQQHQNVRNHLFHFESKSILKLKKKINLGDLNLDKINYISPPVIDRNTIFYSNNDYKIFAKDITVGKLIWTLELQLEESENFPLIAGFYLDNKKLYFASGLGNLYCVNANNGQIIWVKALGAQFSRPPVIYNEKIFLTSDDNQLFALDKSNGKLLWSHLGNIEELSIIGGSKPAIFNDIIVVTYSSGEIFALNEDNGSVIWFDNISTGDFFSKTTVNDIQAPICIVDEKLFVPTFSNKLLLYNLKNGKKSWDIKLSSTNPIVVSGETIYVLDINGKLVALDKLSGKLLWAVQLKMKQGDSEIIWSGPILSSHKLLVISSTGLILSLSPYTGKTLSRIKFKEKFITGPIQVNKNIYLISKRGSLFILG